MATSGLWARAGVVLAIILSVVSPAAWAADHWVPLGPEGGTASAVAVAADGRTVFAGTPYTGVFRSTDAGQSWSPGGPGLRGVVFELQISSKSPLNVYAATSEGVFASFDAARTWAGRNSGLPRFEGHVDVRSLGVSPSQPSTLYAVLRSDLEIQPGFDAVYRSVDSGVTWSRVSRGLALGPLSVQQIFDLAVHPTRPGVVFAGTQRGLFKTTNAGAQWLRSGLDGLAVVRLAINPRNPNRLYAATEGPDGEVIFFSTNGGRTWTRRSHRGISILGGVRRLVADPTQVDTLYAVVSTGNVLRSMNAGKTWKLIQNGIDAHVRAQDLAADPAHAGVLYLGLVPAEGAGPGVFRSANGGGSWTPSADGILATQVLALVADPQVAGTLYAGLRDGGVWKSTDTGATWSQSGLDRQTVYAIAIDPAAPTRLYASAEAGIVVFGSVDAGAHWDPLTGNATDEGGLALAVVGGVLYKAGFNLARWDPGSPGWQILLFGELFAFAASVENGTTTLWTDDLSHMETEGVDILRRKVGNGEWTEILRTPGYITAIVIDPQDPDRVTVAYTRFRSNSSQGRPIDGGLVRTTDGGATWQPSLAAPGAPPIFSVAFDPLDSQHLVAGSLGRIFESLDGGATWSEISQGLPPARVVALAFDRQNTLFAGTWSGVYRLEED